MITISRCPSIFKFNPKYPNYKHYLREVGGMPQIGKLQFDFLVKKGLKKDDIFIDVGCGCLRGGKHFINYLDKGNYLGIDKEERLLQNVLKEQAMYELYINKAPELALSRNFDFELFTKIPNIGIAQSLFTHLKKDGIKSCLNKLYNNSSENFVLYATFFIIKISKKQGDYCRSYYYTRKEIVQMAKETNYKIEIIGNWNHPRKQDMVKFYK